MCRVQSSVRPQLLSSHTPYFSLSSLSAAGAGLGALFAVVVWFTISTPTPPYLFTLPAYLILRYKYPNVHRPYRVPGGMVGAWIVTLLPFAYAAVGSYFILIPSTI